MNTTRRIRSGKEKGFTLLEMLLVIAIIAILAGIVIVAINPARQIASANNAQRRSDVVAILNAVHQYGIDSRGVYTDLTIGSTTPATTTQCLDPTDSSLICTGTVDTNCDIITISSVLVDGDVMYVSAVPRDPSVDADSGNSGYRIIQDSANGRFTVCAPNAENGETISVTR